MILLQIVNNYCTCCVSFQGNQHTFPTMPDDLIATLDNHRGHCEPHNIPPRQTLPNQSLLFSCILAAPNHEKRDQVVRASDIAYLGSLLLPPTSSSSFNHYSLVIIVQSGVPSITVLSHGLVFEGWTYRSCSLFHTRGKFVPLKAV